MDEVSAKVKAQYERFPYPHHPVDAPVEGLAMAASFELAQYARTRRLVPHAGKRALIAGCGTGFELHATAVINPDFGEVVGVDFSEASLAVARQRIAHHGLTTCRVQAGDLMDATTLPAGPFDYIGSHGVLHHLADPLVGLKNVAALLAPGGVMAIMLYNSAGRWPLYQVRKGLKAMGLDALPQAEALPVLKAMIRSAEPDTLLHLVTRGPVNDDYYAHDANLVDNLLHPQDVPFSVRDVPPWLAGAGLEFLEMADEARWRLLPIVDPRCGEFYSRVKDLDGVDQLAVIEALHPLANTEMIFWAARRGEADARWDFDKFTFISARWTLCPTFARFAHVGDRAAMGNDQALKLVDWPLFFPTGQAVWPADWQHALLERLGAGGLSGHEILSALPAQVEAEVLKWFASWERDRVVLRI